MRWISPGKMPPIDRSRPTFSITRCIKGSRSHLGASHSHTAAPTPTHIDAGRPACHGHHLIDHVAAPLHLS
jgi:hypothetical protein